MKRGTPEHFKTMRLATLLSVERPCDRAEALGIVEALCNHFAPRSAPQGNVGRCTNAEIAAGCYTSRSPDTLVCALVDSGWLDESDEYRLTIHDWKDHADEAVRKWLKRNGLQWITASGPCRVLKRKPSRRHLEDIRPPRAGNGNGNGKEVLVLTGGGAGEGSGGAAGSGGQRGRGARKVRSGIPTGWPTDFALTDAHRRFAEDGGLDPELEWGMFRANHQAKGTRFVDWDRAWETWCRRSVMQFGRGAGGGRR